VRIEKYDAQYAAHAEVLRCTADELVQNQLLTLLNYAMLESKLKTSVQLSLAVQ
jgi:hypothetical protein